MKCVYTAIPERRWHLTVLSQMLRDSSIPVHIQGEYTTDTQLNYLSGDIGLQLFILNENDFDQAKLLIQEFEERSRRELSEKVDYGSNKLRKWILRIGRSLLFIYLLVMLFGYIFIYLMQFLLRE